MKEDESYELMYRRPGGTEHENITKVLDDILNRIKEIETFLEFDEEMTNTGLTD